MFTGLVEEVGVVRAIDLGADQARVTIEATTVMHGTEVGDSIAVSGVCLTVVELTAHSFGVDVMRETLRATTVGTWTQGGRVNLERALRADARLGGHIVQGHVDGVGTVRDVEAGRRWHDVTIAVPEPLARYVASKGSLALDGVSLTVARMEGSDATVSLIPATLAATTLGDLRTGDAVNVETDVLAKYVERLMEVGQ